MLPIFSPAFMVYIFHLVYGAFLTLLALGLTAGLARLESKILLMGLNGGVETAIEQDKKSSHIYMLFNLLLAPLIGYSQ